MKILTLKITFLFMKIYRKRDSDRYRYVFPNFDFKKKLMLIKITMVTFILIALDFNKIIIPIIIKLLL